MKLTQSQLITAYSTALNRLGSYSDIRIDAVTRDWCNEICVHYLVDGEWVLYFQGSPEEFKPL